MSIGDRIKSRRLQLNMTQGELASKVNIKRQTIQKYEQGIITNLPLDRVQALADALEVSPAYLMGWDEKKPANSEWNSELEKENYELFKSLSAELQRAALDYVRYLIDKSNND